MESCQILKDGTCPNTWHHHWLSMVRAKEEKEKSATTDASVIVPRRFDVLFGKETRAREHTGTLRALHIVEMYFEEYEKLGKYQKTDVAEKIISIIHMSEGRFLKQNGDDDGTGAWMEVDDTEARKKIAHWFRHARTKRSRQPQQLDPDDAGVGKNKEMQTGAAPRTTHKRAIPARVSPVEPNQLANEITATDEMVHHGRKKLNSS